MLAKVKSTFSEWWRHPQISHTEADPPPPYQPVAQIQHRVYPNVA
jgi:hypothetical protein